VIADHPVCMMSSFQELTDCLYYPNCTNSSCKYRHIQRTREIFSVDCEKWLLYQCFDKNCLYLHRRAVAAEDSGVVLCKYNSVGCKRDDCPYLHVRSKSESPRDSVSPRDSSQKSESPRDSSQNEVTQENADDKKRKASAILNKYAYKQKKNDTTLENENSKAEVVTDGALSSPRTFGGDGAHKKKVILSESDLSGDKEGSSSD